MATKARTKFDCVYQFDKNPKRDHLNGHFCRVVATGSGMHSALIEFEDGQRIVTTANAVHHRKT